MMKVIKMAVLMFGALFIGTVVLATSTAPPTDPQELKEWQAEKLATATRVCQGKVILAAKRAFAQTLTVPSSFEVISERRVGLTHSIEYTEAWGFGRRQSFHNISLKGLCEYHFE